MRMVLNVITVFLLATSAFSQAHDGPSNEDKTKEQIQKLFSDLNEAIVKKDRARLEQLYADDFQFIRPSGAVLSKTSHISGILANDPLSSTPVAATAADRLMVYGDVAVARNTVRGTAVTSIFVKKKANGNSCRRRVHVLRQSAIQ